MKIIKPNNTKVGQLDLAFSKYIKIDEAIRIAVKLNDGENIEHAKLEREGNLLGATNMHSFMEAINLAYSFHLPLVITPDIIWHLISTGFSIYINQNAEILRQKFVNHEGKETIKIRRNDFRLNAKNPWHEVIDEFSIKIGEKTKNEIADIIVSNFTTTTKDSRVVSQIVLMDSMQNYFDYRMSTMCDIPEIRLHGEKYDWENLKSKTQKMINLLPELNVWMESLSEVLDNFIKAFDDKIDKNFWNQIYKEAGGSGGPYITGWVLNLFPFVGDTNTKNPYVWEMSWKNLLENKPFQGLTSDSFPSRLSKAPFTWEYFNQEIKMAFLGGLVGISHDNKDQALQPVFGYAILKN